MDWLMHNPVADLSGPAFLLVYALVALAVIVASRRQVASADASGTLDTAPVSVDRDPSAIAFLRGGGNELLRFTIFDLIRQGYLRVADPPKGRKVPQQIVQTGAAGSEQLSQLQRALIAFYAVPHTTPELFASGLPAQAAAFGDASYKSALESEGYYSSPGLQANATLVRLYGALALTAFSAYRLFLAIVKGHNNVILLGILTVVALAVLLLATRVPRLSRRVRSYLQRLATALRPAPGGPVAAGAGMLPLLIAVTGMGALAGTEYAQMNTLFPRQASGSSSGSCSGGCGGSSSSGSDGGGGGGGGCGGGCGG